jgi:hypothetical protein
MQLKELFDRAFTARFDKLKGWKTALFNGNDILKILGEETAISDINQEAINHLIAELSNKNNKPATIN